jgi:uncharacterized protein (DUF1778 family)
MPAKTEQLQIRVTTQQKAALKRLARAAGSDVSQYVLSRLLPANEDRFPELVRSILSGKDHRYALAELNDFLHACPPVAFGDAVAHGDVSGLTPYLQNYVAAMVEQAAAAKEVAPPPWVRDIAPLDSPVFATSLRSVRLHLLRSAPVPFKRRNIFVDASIGARV